MKNFIGLAIVLALVGGGYVLYNHQQTIAKLTVKMEPTAITPTPAPDDSGISQPASPTTQAEPIDNTPNVAASPAVTTSATSKAVVVFQAEGSIPAIDKSQLLARVVDPILDYYEETVDDSPVVSLTIKPSTDADESEYPYIGTIIFADGGSNGFVITKKGDSIAWWAPGCMVCVFSESYKAKYPDVVSQSL